MSTSEVRLISELIAGFTFDRVTPRTKYGPKEEFIKAQWPFWEPLAKDIIIFLLGDEYDLEGDAPRTQPQLVCQNPECEPGSEC